MSKFNDYISSLMLEQEPSALPTGVPQGTAALPPDTIKPDNTTELNALQLAAKALIFDPATISPDDKIQLANYADKGVRDDNKTKLITLLNSYLS